MFCKNCGKQISYDSRFCRYCGTLVEEIEEVLIENNVKATVQNRVIEPIKEEQTLKIEIKKQHSSTAKIFANEVIGNLKMIGLAIGLFLIYMVCFIVYHQKDIKPMDDFSYWGESCYDPSTLSGQWWFDWERHYALEVQFYESRNVLAEMNDPGKMADFLLRNQHKSQSDRLFINNLNTDAALTYAEEKAKEKGIDSTLLKQYKESAILDAEADKKEFYDIINASREQGYKNEKEEHTYTSLFILLSITILGRYFIKFFKWVSKNKS